MCLKKLIHLNLSRNRRAGHIKFGKNCVTSARVFCLGSHIFPEMLWLNIWRVKTSYGAPEFSVPAPNRYLSRWKILSCNIFLIYRSKTRNRSMCNQRAINVHLFSNSRTIYCFPNFQTCDELGVHWLAGGARLCDCVKATTPPAAPQSAPTCLSAASMRTKWYLLKVHNVPLCLSAASMRNFSKLQEVRRALTTVIEKLHQNWL